MMRACILLLAVSCSAASHGPTPVPAAIVPPEPAAPEPPVVGWVDDQAFPIERIWIFSLDNENTRWEVVLTSVRASPEHFAGDLRAVHVDFGGSPHAVTGFGGSPGVVYFNLIVDRSQAEAYAKLLGIPARGRVDPLLTIGARLESPASDVVPEQGASARLLIENDGPSAFAFRGDAAGMIVATDTRLEISIERDGVPLTRGGAALDFGGIQRTLTLEPGAVGSLIFDLGAWTDFAQPGFYRIRVKYSLEVDGSDPDSRERYDGMHLRWDQPIVAECERRVG